MIARLAERIPDWTLPLIARLGAAAVFFQSGRTKVEGLLHVTPSTVDLFASEYKVPLIPPNLAAYSETLFPVLLVLGLFTRLSALALLGMVLVIQTFVYPDAWPTHLSWAGLLVPLIVRGGGAAALDHWLWRGRTPAT